MRNIKVKSLVSVFQVSDINKSVEWYRKWLGEPDSMPLEGVVEYEITPGTWLQLLWSSIFVTVLPNLLL